MGKRSYTASFLFVDGDGNEARMQTSVPVSVFSFSQAEAYFTSLAPALQSISDAALVSFNISRTFEPTNQSEPGAFADVTRTGVFVVSLETGNYAFVLVPSIRLETLIPSDGLRPDGLIDLELASVVDWRTRILGLTDEYSTPIIDTIIAGLAR